MSKCYAFKKDPKDNVESLSLVDQALQLNCLRKSDIVLLNEKLLGGLNRSLKISPCINECDTTGDYDEFKFDLLLLEVDE